MLRIHPVVSCRVGCIFTMTRPSHPSSRESQRRLGRGEIRPPVDRRQHDKWISTRSKVDRVIKFDWRHRLDDERKRPVSGHVGQSELLLGRPQTTSVGVHVRGASAFIHPEFPSGAEPAHVHKHLFAVVQVAGRGDMNGRRGSSNVVVTAHRAHKVNSEDPFRGFRTDGRGEFVRTKIRCQYGQRSRPPLKADVDVGIPKSFHRQKNREPRSRIAPSAWLPR